MRKYFKFEIEYSKPIFGGRKPLFYTAAYNLEEEEVLAKGRHLVQVLRGTIGYTFEYKRTRISFWNDDLTIWIFDKDSTFKSIEW